MYLHCSVIIDGLFSHFGKVCFSSHNVIKQVVEYTNLHLIPFQERYCDRHMNTKSYKLTSRRIIILFTLVMLIILLVFPKQSLEGAENGLLLWFNVILPTLLPFIIISNLVIELKLTRYFAKVFYFIFHTIFRVTKDGCYPIVIGLLTGFPVGAKACGDLVKSNMINKNEGQYLLTFCNNASPIFIISFIAMTSLGVPKMGNVILLIIYASAILTSVIYRIFYHFVNPWRLDFTVRFPLKAQEVSTDTRPIGFQIFDKTILDGFEVVTKVGGYIILFSILSRVVVQLQILPSFLNNMVVGILEITNGIHVLSATSLPLTQKIALISALTAFGGFSSIAQTKSVIDQSGLSIKKYIVFKLVNACLTFTLFYLYFAISHML